MNKILMLANNSAGLYNFRIELIQHLLKNGYEVHFVVPEHKDNKRVKLLMETGANYIQLKMSRRGINPLEDLKLIKSYKKIIKEVKPDVVLTYTIKPNVYGGLASSLLRVPYISNITGLGTSIENKGFIQKVSLFLYKVGLRKAECVFFQNKTNKHFFTLNNIVKGRTRLISGSGVNLANYSFEEYPYHGNLSIKFLFIGRVMKSKGIKELLEAAEKVKKLFPNVQFDLVGSTQEDYQDKIEELENKGIIKYHGRQNTVHSFIKNCHAIINPSHHEGMSNVLLEAASTGRPIISSSIPGCKETFDEGISGLSFEVKNSNSLVDTIITFIKLPFKEKVNMGLAGRRKMEEEFDRNIIVNAYVEEIDRILNKEKTK